MRYDPPRLEPKKKAAGERRGEAFIYTAGNSPKGESILQRMRSCAREHEVKNDILQSGCSFNDTIRTASYQGRFLDRK